jgi:hypothetical protein
MKVDIIRESGIEVALLGIGLSYGVVNGVSFEKFLTESDMKSKLFSVAERLAHQQGGHNKFLESMIVWMDVSAPLFFWSEFDTYRVGMTKNSESTMHTLLKNTITGNMFEYELEEKALHMLEVVRKSGDLVSLKALLPSGFRQRRICCTNYKTLQNIYYQRKTHKLPQWTHFCDEILKQLKYPQFINNGSNGE